jgi:hypothetical protein
MQAVRNIGIRFAALLAIGGLLAFPAAAQSDDAMEQFRLVAATSAAKLSAKTENKDRGVVVYVMRGWLDVFSTGMDDLAAKMKTRGINAVPMSHSDHLHVAAEIIARHKKGIKERPVLIGHSLGANATVSMAAELGKAGIHVPLIVMFDPTAENLSVPSNVGRAVNFFQSNNGWGVKVGRGTGFKGKLENVDLFKEELGHTGIDKSPRLHLQSISFVQSLRGVRDPAEEPAPRPRPKIEHAGEPKATPALLSSEPKAEAKSESKTAPTAPAVPVASPASSEAKAPATSAATEPKPAAEKPAEPSKSSSEGKPDGLFSDIKRPTL